MRKEVKALKPHVSINVRNVRESIEFYRKMLGIEPAKVRTGYARRRRKFHAAEASGEMLSVFLENAPADAALCCEGREREVFTND